MTRAILGAVLGGLGWLALVGLWSWTRGVRQRRQARQREARERELAEGDREVGRDGMNPWQV